jgi:peptidoglycan/xylan/chitin deacetylase (PgdA/CDA1 family)
LNSWVVGAAVAGSASVGYAAWYGRSSSRSAIAARYEGRKPTQWGMDLPGIMTSLDGDDKRIALTFDACGTGNKEINEELLNFLTAQQIPATLFLNQRWIVADPRVQNG